jgi:hypothetical protein
VESALGGRPGCGLQPRGVGLPCEIVERIADNLFGIVGTAVAERRPCSAVRGCDRAAARNLSPVRT